MKQQIMKSDSKRHLKIGIIILVLFGLFFAISYLPLQRWGVETKNDSASSTPVVVDNPFDHIQIGASAAYVLDLTNNQVLFAKNENLPLPLASLTKLMTALVSSQILSPDEIVTVSSSSLAIDGDNGLVLGERWKFKDLLDFTLLVSSNDGAHAIAEAASGNAEAFVQKMNAEAMALNFPTFRFNNESGLDIDDAIPGAVGSARDVSRLFENLIKNHQDLLEITKYRKFKLSSLDGKVYNLSNTDEAITQISQIIASKTGFTQLAGGNLVIAYDPGLNHPILITILGSTQSGRFADAVTLASSTSAYILGQ